MQLSLPVIYSQLDPQWKDHLLGFNTNLPFTFGNYACLVASLATVARYYGKNESPATVDQRLKIVEGYLPGGAIYVHGSFHKIFGDLTEERNYIIGSVTDDHIRDIANHVRSGHPVMVQIDYNPRTVQSDMHFVLVIGIDDNTGDFIIGDPIGGRVKSIRDYLGHFRPNVKNTLVQYIKFTGPLPQNHEGGQMVCDTKEVRDRLVTKATSTDKIGAYLQIPQEAWETVGFADNVIKYIELLRTENEGLKRSLEAASKNSNGENMVIIDTPATDRLSESDKSLLHREVSDILQSVFDKIFNRK